VCLAPEIAPFSIFTQRDPESQQDIEETLDIRALYDSSVLEIFVNERVAITTRIYSANKNCFGITFFAQGCPGLDEAELAEVLDCQVWDGIGCN
jgi:beta-fructofuranosidase